MNYASPILDDIARRTFARLVLAGERGMTVRELAAEIDAHPSTLGNVLRGASVTYGTEPFARAGRQGRAFRWQARGAPGGVALEPTGQ